MRYVFLGLLIWFVLTIFTLIDMGDYCVSLGYEGSTMAHYFDYKCF